ncbi:unnamed protein product [Nippostrongylus brasiliensis]|uniref:Transposase n=1 Tax=Nippostrongylus brasiliensis TaxID=27835 RepID=A0A0N4Y210_NIPBR|nr:unnamed protein product [Nippostrongylus brasiliensis]
MVTERWEQFPSTTMMGIAGKRAHIGHDVLELAALLSSVRWFARDDDVPCTCGAYLRVYLRALLDGI